MNELKLKMPISIEPSTTDKGYVITDATNTKYFFYEEDGKLVCDEDNIEPLIVKDIQMLPPSNPF